MARLAVLAAACAVVALVGGAAAEHAVPVFRLAQYDLGGTGDDARELGSRGAAVDFLATAARAGADGEVELPGGLAPTLIQRRVVVLSLADASSALVMSVLEAKPGALLLVIPSDLSHVGAAELQRWRALEAALLQQRWPSPVYFANSEEASEVAKTLADAFDTTVADNFQIAVAAGAAAPIKPLHARNLQGWLSGAALAGKAADAAAVEDEDEDEEEFDDADDDEFDEEDDEGDFEDEEYDDADGDDDSALPIIAIVASYDTFGAAPLMPAGADSNGSGVAALLELARLFNRLYSGVRQRGSHNLLFLLTAGSPFNFAGTRHWLSEVDSRVLDAADFAVCLDSIGSGNELFMHTSKKEKTESIKSLFSTFRTTAARLNVPFEIVHKKVNPNADQVTWEHEHLALARVVAMTFSAQREPSTGLTRTSIFDTMANVDTAVLERNTRFIAESLAAFIYSTAGENGEQGALVFTGSLGVDRHYMEAWMNALMEQSRSVQGLRDPTNPVEAALFEELRQHVSDAHKQNFAITPEEVILYEPKSTATSGLLTASLVKPVVFDLAFTGAVVVYLGLLTVLVTGPSNFSMADVKAIFAAQKPKRA